ncbi:hypothetical protein IFT48_05085 [Pseudomonas fluorescens]|uniref:hypothetical protein n=1 Tax=Pseudomonas TaxID=286 RepID=UPI000F01275D|nr:MULTISPECIES: hypothetical protein [Pseudomonas]MBD8089350.1 hypothetical protein [Pseudomonas fluorescens]MBD8615223.1 hypothetical protein [Pseudomonas putida]MBD8682123.1 hypothetical protein [Pseudomonas sp. CFBP 13719]
MNSKSHMGVLRALELAKLTSRAWGDQWLAIIEVSCKGFGDEQRGALSEHLVGIFEDESGCYLVQVSDNTETPIRFETKELALLQARQLGTSLISKYCFSVYSTTGESIQYVPKPTLHFMPGHTKKT